MPPCLSRLLARFFSSDDGVSAVEYAVLLSLIVVVCAASLTALGRHSRRTLNYTSKELKLHHAGS
jgi:pilus assembly protein Flp/PilA